MISHIFLKSESEWSRPSILGPKQNIAIISIAEMPIDLIIYEQLIFNFFDSNLILFNKVLEKRIIYIRHRNQESFSRSDPIRSEPQNFQIRSDPRFRSELLGHNYQKFSIKFNSI